MAFFVGMHAFLNSFCLVWFIIFRSCFCFGQQQFSDLIWPCHAPRWPIPNILRLLCTVPEQLRTHQCLVQIWRQLQAGAGAASKSEPAQQMSEATQRLPSDLRTVLTAGSARDVRVCRTPDADQGIAVLVVAEPSQRLSASELKWASMIAKKVQARLQPQPTL